MTERIVGPATVALIGAALMLATVPVGAGAMTVRSTPVAVGPTGVIFNPGPSFSPQLTGPTRFSRNWSGYARAQDATTSVAGSWTVPAVPASGGDAYSASWVGVDGYGNGQLIQTGTGQDTENGQSLYFAWWEVLPHPETVISSIVVSPGDRMTAGLAKAGAGDWTITLRDLTTGKQFSATEPYRGSGASAEWIEEAPVVDGEQSTLADFKAVDFSAARVDGAPADLLSTQAIDMIGAGGVIAHPSLPGASADDFVVAYGHIGAPVVTVPGPPTGLRAVSGRHRATLSWRAPADDGGVPVTSYTVTVSSAGKPVRRIVTAASSLAVTGLTDGTRYTFTVTARNAVGAGRPSSPSPSVIPSSVPGAPTRATARATTHAAVVHWAAPSSDGGAAVTRYNVAVWAHGHRIRTYVVSRAARGVVVQALLAHTAYTFAITATNLAGTGSTAAVGARTT